MACAVLLVLTSLLSAQSIQHPTKPQRLDWHQLETADGPNHDWSELQALEGDTVRMYGQLASCDSGGWVLQRPFHKHALQVPLVLRPPPDTASAFVELTGLLELQTPISERPNAQLTGVQVLPKSPPKLLAWSALDCDMQDVFLAELESYYWVPEFSEEQLALDGEQVQLSGHVVWIDEDTGWWVLSRFEEHDLLHRSSNIGLCEIVDIRLRTGWMPRENVPMVVTGQLVLNKTDVEAANYILLVETAAIQGEAPIEMKHKHKSP